MRTEFGKENLAGGRIVWKPLPLMFWSLALALEFALKVLTKRQSRFWHWGPLCEYIPDEAPFGMVSIGGDSDAKPRTGKWSSFWQTNFGWKKVVILRPQTWMGLYHIGFMTVENGVPKIECCELLIEGAVACLVGPSDVDFFAVIKSNGGYDFVDLELIGITTKSRLPATVPLV